METRTVSDEFALAILEKSVFDPILGTYAKQDSYAIFIEPSN